MLLLLVLALAFFILSITFFRGKGAWLIAGYNTISEKEKQQYDVKKLCWSTGVVCIICAVMLLVMAYLGHRVEAGLMPENYMIGFALLFTAVILAAAIWAGIYTNKKAKK